MTTRRRLLAAAAGLPALALARRVAAASPTLELATPPGLPAVYLHRLLRNHPTLAGHRLALRTWRDPGQLRTWVASGRIDGSVSPTNVAANLHNRGFEIGLLDVSVWGLLHVLVAGGETDAGLGQLRGRRVGIPFRDDMPDVVFRRVLQAVGLHPGDDLEPVYLGTPVEAAQMFLARRLDALVLPEPAASLVRERAGMLGIGLAELDLQQLWAEHLGGAPRLPQAGTLCSRGLAEAEPELVAALSTALAEAVGWVGANPEAAAEAAADDVDLPAPALAAALGRARLEHRSARAARSDVEAFLGGVAELKPALIGGGLPGAGFYLA